MIVSRKSPFTGKINVMELDVTPEQLAELDSPRRRLIQEILPTLTAVEREFVKTGYTQEDWELMFAGESSDFALGVCTLRDMVYGNN